MSTTIYPHVGDVGTVIRLTITDQDGAAIPLDGSATIELKRPGGTTATKTGSIVGDGSTGQVQYVTEADDLDVAGTWHAQAHVTDADGDTWSSDIEQFRVRRNLS